MLLLILNEEPLRIDAAIMHDVVSARIVPIEVSQIIAQVDGVLGSRARHGWRNHYLARHH